MDEKQKTDKTVLIMACAILAIGFGYLFAVTFLSMPPAGEEHSKTIVGFVIGVGISTLLNYYWGSSKGSAAKSETIASELSPPPKPEVKP